MDLAFRGSLDRERELRARLGDPTADPMNRGLVRGEPRYGPTHGGGKTALCPAVVSQESIDRHGAAFYARRQPIVNAILKFTNRLERLCVEA